MAATVGVVVGVGVADVVVVLLVMLFDWWLIIGLICTEMCCLFSFCFDGCLKTTIKPKGKQTRVE